MLMAHSSAQLLHRLDIPLKHHIMQHIAQKCQPSPKVCVYPVPPQIVQHLSITARRTTVLITFLGGPEDRQQHSTSPKLEVPQQQCGS